ncbi:MAG: Two-component response regulator family protein [uncultured Sulfurovum sp.]|uniref:Two-component response regulator family protein n=1 Tax=uncultured Sulfurovum sp. TaxID=269237 RepID=A0A6S6S7B4_9BACT|nr:MAG: Two-component response regulator family protein [uncultured Sulfurovum sp.]
MNNEKYALLKNKTLLYAEDDLELQSEVEEILNNFFKKIFIASDGDEALDIFIEHQNNIDLIITDITMPNTDGIALSKYVREYNKNLPIIIMSAYTNTDYLLDSIDLNIITYITKPFTTKKVFVLLDKLLDFFNLNNQFTFKDNSIFNFELGTIIIGQEKISLTNKESNFIKLLIENNIVTYDMMYEYLWDYDSPPTSNAVKSFIKKIKKKIPMDFFKNKQGIGYYLNQ